ncbi:hypothetical protein EUTSA_v10000380mg [Eutrema salsugineum]|uniref:Phytosulfokine n=1 Tax=Eutrema salsugineum TaxID=72664 RepID=V4M1X1_EUTSA|nr:hypothetical protein EUTSA_v10000380mg [Eutrema salsugineum]
MSKTNILIVAALLLSFMVITSLARPDSTLQSKSTCETQECLMKSTSDAHLDYIYTQQSPPKPHALKEMEKKCETEECLMKTTSDAHLDYIYTQPSPAKPHALKANP